MWCAVWSRVDIVSTWRTPCQHAQPVLVTRSKGLLWCYVGTGKSTYINKHLVQGLPKESWAPIFMTFSARTTANMAQDQVCKVAQYSAKRWYQHIRKSTCK